MQGGTGGDTITPCFPFPQLPIFCVHYRCVPKMASPQARAKKIKFQCWCHMLFQCCFVWTFKHVVLTSCFHVLLHGVGIQHDPNKLDHVSEIIVVYLQWPCRRREQHLLGFNVGAICCFNVVSFECLNILFKYVSVPKIASPEARNRIT